MTLENLKKRLTFVKDPKELKALKERIARKMLHPKYANLLEKPKEEKHVKKSKG